MYKCNTIIMNDFSSPLALHYIWAFAGPFMVNTVEISFVLRQSLEGVVDIYVNIFLSTSLYEINTVKIA